MLKNKVNRLQSDYGLQPFWGSHGKKINLRDFQGNNLSEINIRFKKLDRISPWSLDLQTPVNQSFTFRLILVCIIVV